MYLGLALVLLAWCLFVDSWWALIVVPLFVWVLTTVQIKPEEETLRELFGDEYASYCQRVRRWL